MLPLVRQIPDQLEDGWERAGAAIQTLSGDVPRSLLVCGMGGSGISGDLIRGLLLHTSPVPVDVVKDYTLPGWVGEGTFAAVISYSGNTEEVLVLWDALRQHKVRRIAISSGGKLTELARSDDVAVIEVPTGYPPRASIGYLFSGLLRLVHYWGLYPRAERELFAATALIRSRIAKWEAQAQSLAESLKDTFPVIHCLGQRFSALGYRLACEINENAKMLAHVHTFPEMNHNEINGFEKGVDDRIVLVILDPGHDFCHPRNRRRAEIIDKMLPRSVPRFSIQAEGASLLERFISLLVIGDLLSVYLAQARGVDPVPVNFIERLKKELG
ncbi:bifunctional phosphoglucose/phosphomannose isomerase [candidate division WOR-3 bacterium]|nr:bifunctional phosphoglucose/phosphomannose isomerase [candidate division WOR-3 bacterium]